jgi:hypothetical protein
MRDVRRLKDEKEVEVGPPWNPLARRVPRREKRKKDRDEEEMKKRRRRKGKVEKSRVYIVEYSLVIGQCQNKLASDWSNPYLACRAAGTWRVDLPGPGSPAWDRASQRPVWLL